MKNKAVMMSKIRGTSKLLPEHVFNHPYLTSLHSEVVMSRKDQLELENYKQKLFLTNKWKYLKDFKEKMFV